jgi:hypothetical protein
MAANEDDETGKLSTRFEHCLRYRGKTDRENYCPGCVLPPTVCKEAMDEFEKKQWALRRKDFRIGTMDQNMILETALNRFIQRYVNRDLPRVKKVSAIVSDIFNSERADYFRKSPQFGDPTMKIKGDPPEGLDRLIEQNPQYLSLANSMLSAKPELPKKVYTSLQDLSLASDWKKKVDKLYKNSWKAMETSLEDLTAHPGEYDPRITALEDMGNDLFCHIWKKLGSRAANGCIALHEKYGEELFLKGELDREAVARIENLTVGTLNTRIERCLKLIEKEFIPILEKMATNEAKACVQLLVALFGHQEEGRGLGRNQRREKVAAGFEITPEQLDSKARKCGDLALARLVEV